MSKATIGVIGSRVHIGTTMLASYLSDWLDVSFVSNCAHESVETLERLMDTAKAGWFQFADRQVKPQIELLIGSTPNEAPIVPKTLSPNPTIYILVTWDTLATKDTAHYLVARALAAIDLPLEYFKRWSPATPVTKPKLDCVVKDLGVTTQPPTRYVQENSYVDPQIGKPYSIIAGWGQLIELLRDVPPITEHLFTVGLKYKARFLMNSPEDSIVVTILTINGQWGVLELYQPFKVGNEPVLVAFDRRFVYDLIKFCNCENGKKSPVVIYSSGRTAMADLLEQMTAAIQDSLNQQVAKQLAELGVK